jgi:hypothetical protein
MHRSGFEDIFEVINDAAQACLGVIPSDRFKDPCMPREELRREIEHGVRFWDPEPTRSGTAFAAICILQSATRKIRRNQRV